jgi:23S rRNA pseudouridine955/2504/2580 synthase
MDDHPVRMVEVGDEAGQRIDNFLLSQLKNVPKSRIYRMIRKGEVRVNGGRIKPTHRLKEGDRVRIPPYRGGVENPVTFVGDRQLAEVEAAILHEDGGLLVLNKPAGLAVHGGSGVSYGVIEALRKLRPQGRLELVHRLDRETSGCLLVAKKRSVLRSLHEQIRNGSLVKAYTLIVHGQWSPDLVRVDASLTRFVTAGGERRVRVDANGKPCLTEFEVEAQAGDATLLKAVLHTGRTHQIRVHASSSGHSIVADEKYASPAELEADRALGIQSLCLHAARIEIPGEDEIVVFEAPPPAEFTAAWRTFEDPKRSTVGSVAED